MKKKYINKRTFQKISENFMRVGYIQVPSCGAPPQYEIHTANFDNTLYQFDWNLVNRMNPEYIKATGETSDLEKLIYSFVDSKFGAVERQFLPFPLSAKFYELLQIGFDYVLKKQTKLQQQLKKKDEEIEYLRHKLEKSLETIPKFVGRDVSIVHSCPVCNKAFKSFYHLDKHINKTHGDLKDAWNALRNQQPYGAPVAFEELHQEINHLRECITRQELVSFEKPKPKREKMPGPQKEKKQTQTVDPGRIVESTCIQPFRYRSDFIDSDFIDIPPKS